MDIVTLCLWGILCSTPVPDRACSQDFQAMDNAPRDGTLIEICENSGYRAYYSLVEFKNLWGEDVWLTVPERDNMAQYYGQDVEPSMKWRNTTQKRETYVDPTNGRQNTPEYWR